MKSILVKSFKELGIRKIAGKKLESYNFYELVGYWKRIVENHEDIK